MARTEKPIDWKKVNDLLMAGCTGPEIAPHFDIGYDTLYDRVVKEFGISYTQYSQALRQKGDALLRAKQFDIALKGDKTMLVWLGKNRLKQAETPTEVSIDAKTMKHFDEIMGQLNQFQARNIADNSNSKDEKSA